MVSSCTNKITSQGTLSLQSVRSGYISGLEYSH